MKSSLIAISGLCGLVVCAAVSTTPAFADVYAYHGANGERILTDKRINDKHFRLVKTYKTPRITPLPKAPVKKNKTVTQTASAKDAPSGKLLRKQCASAAYLQRKKQTYQNTIRHYAAKYGVDEALVHSVVKQESCFNEKALSRAGAIGLMQLMPGTASHLKIKNPWNPEQNIHGGVKYLSWMLKRFNGNKSFALAAYNAGPGKVDKYGGIPPYRETQHYVKTIMAEYQRLKTAGL